MNYWDNRYLKQGYELYGGVLNTGDDRHKQTIQERINFFKQWTQEEDFKVALDYGCGNGYMCTMFEDYTGWDIVPEIIEQNKKKYPDKNFDLVDDIIYDKFFDLILCLSSLQYLNDYDLKCKLQLFAHNCHNLIIQDSTTRGDEHTYYRTHEELKNICMDYKFRVYKEIPEGSRWLWLK